MLKKTTIKFDAQTVSQQTFFVDRHQDSINTIEGLFIRGDFVKALDKVILTPKEKSPSREKK